MEIGELGFRLGWLSRHPGSVFETGVCGRAVEAGVPFLEEAVVREERGQQRPRWGRCLVGQGVGFAFQSLRVNEIIVI